MTFRRACALITVAALATAGAATAAPAAATDPPAVQVGTVADELTTTAGQLVLAGSGGVDTGPAAGPYESRTMISGIPAASSLVEAPDGTVYASGSAGLFSITGSAATAIGTGSFGCLGDVAATRAAIWVVSSCEDGNPTDPRIVSISTGGAGGTDPVITADAVTVDPGGPVRLASVPDAPDLLAVADATVPTSPDSGGVPTRRARVFDIGAGSATASYTTDFGAGDGVPVLALSPNGTRLLAGAGYSTSVFDLAHQRYFADLSYFTGHNDMIKDAAFTVDGRHAAVAWSGDDGRGGVTTYDVAAAGRVARFTTYRDSAVPVAVAWSASDLLAAVPYAGGDVLQSTTRAYQGAVTAALHPPTYPVVWGGRVTIVGTLASAFGAALPGVTVSVTRSGPGGTVALPSRASDADGVFRIADTPAQPGRYAYRVTRLADEEFAAFSTTLPLTIGPRPNSLSLRFDRANYEATQPATVTIRLGHWNSNRTVRLFGEGWHVPRQLIRTGTVDRSGVFRTKIYMPFTSRFTATYSGDSHYAATSTRVTRTVRVRAFTSTSKPLATKGAYRIFRAKKPMAIAANVSPWVRSARVGFVVQELHGKRWRSWGSGSARVDNDGWSVLRFTGGRGERYRFRASIADSPLARGRTTAWRYLSFR